MSIKVIQPPETALFNSQFGFSSAVQAGDFVFVSGQVGTGAKGAVPEDPAKQFELAFINLGSVLEAAGLGFEDIVDLTTYHVGLSQHIREFTQVKSNYISEPFPTWTAIGVQELAIPDLLVELKVIAQTKGNQ